MSTNEPERDGNTAKFPGKKTTVKKEDCDRLNDFISVFSLQNKKKNSKYQMLWERTTNYARNANEA